jgi:DNA-directed RNA polymerase subunit RPC12/RpoP
MNNIRRIIRSSVVRNKRAGADNTTVIIGRELRVELRASAACNPASSLEAYQQVLIASGILCDKGWNKEEQSIAFPYLCVLSKPVSKQDNLQDIYKNEIYTLPNSLLSVVVHFVNKTKNYRHMPIEDYNFSYEDSFYICSHCGEGFYESMIVVDEDDWMFCPHCGSPFERESESVYDVVKEIGEENIPMGEEELLAWILKIL